MLKGKSLEYKKSVFESVHNGHNEFQKAIRKASVKRIRIHDLRHSHVSLLIHMGFSAVAIGERVGHKSERITYYYAHLFPGEQESISSRMDIERKGAANRKL